MTAVFVVLGVILGAAIGGVSGLFFGGVVGFLLSRQRDLRRRLKSVEEAQVTGIAVSEPPPPEPRSLLPPPPPPGSVPFKAAPVAQPVPDGPRNQKHRRRTLQATAQTIMMF